MIFVYLGRWSYGRFKDDNNIFYKLKNDLTTGTWQDDIWCPIIIILLCTSDAGWLQESQVCRRDRQEQEQSRCWNKIVKEQTKTDPLKNLQGVSGKGPRGLLHESFDDCVMFHLLTVFPNNAAEWEKYYLSNMLKKPQRVGVHQFVQHL